MAFPRSSSHSSGFIRTVNALAFRYFSLRRLQKNASSCSVFHPLSWALPAGEVLSCYLCVGLLGGLMSGQLGWSPIGSITRWAREEFYVTLQEISVAPGSTPKSNAP